MINKERKEKSERERGRSVGETGGQNEQWGGRERYMSVKESWTEKDR